MALIEVDAECETEMVWKFPEKRIEFLGEFYKINKYKESILINTKNIRKVVKAREFYYKNDEGKNLGLYLVVLFSENTTQKPFVKYFEYMFDRDEYFLNLKEV